MRILLLTKDGCKPCTRVKRILGELKAAQPGLAVEEIDFGSTLGRGLAVENGILYPPAVFVDGRLLAYGKIHEAALRAAVAPAAGRGDR